MSQNQTESPRARKTRVKWSDEEIATVKREWELLQSSETITTVRDRAAEAQRLLPENRRRKITMEKQLQQLGILPKQSSGARRTTKRQRSAPLTGPNGADESHALNPETRAPLDRFVSKIEQLVTDLVDHVFEVAENQLDRKLQDFRSRRLKLISERAKATEDAQ
jgi:hypothetical protein